MPVDPYIGEIQMFAGNFAPRGWALCNGQLLSTQDHSSLFSIIGTIYGGNGSTTFALPDLRGRVPIHAGSGAGLSAYSLGQSGGSESTTHGHSSSDEIHSHELIGAPGGSGLAATTAARAASGVATTNVSHQPPFLSINFIIALEGVFPPRS
jgi:microcystin-dependent protein